MYDDFLDKKAKEIQGYDFMDALYFEEDVKPVETEFSPDLETKEILDLKKYKKQSSMSVVEHFLDFLNAFTRPIDWTNKTNNTRNLTEHKYRQEVKKKK